MAKFIALTSTAGKRIYVNVDRVWYMQPLSSNPKHTQLQFSGEKTLNVDVTLDEITAKLGQSNDVPIE